MGISSYYSDPDWYYGPKYVVIIALSPLDHEPYFDGNTRIHQSWDFKNSKICKWLEENCKEKYNYVWGIELEDDCMLVYIGFVIEEHVKAFKQKFKTVDWNMECNDSNLPTDIEVYELFYNLEEYNDDIIYEKTIEAIQWCRENIRDIWKYTRSTKYTHEQDGMFLYFRCEADAAAFKLRFL